MSHGKAIVLDSPSEIKRKFGVGYNLIIELKKQSNNGEDIRENPVRTKIKDLLLEANLSGATTSVELTDSKKIVCLVPAEHATKLSHLLKKLEQIPEIIVAVEMTSLEDAYL